MDVQVHFAEFEAQAVESILCTFLFQAPYRGDYPDVSCVKARRVFVCVGLEWGQVRIPRTREVAASILETPRLR